MKGFYTEMFRRRNFSGIAIFIISLKTSIYPAGTYNKQLFHLSDFKPLLLFYRHALKLFFKFLEHLLSN